MISGALPFGAAVKKENTHGTEEVLYHHPHLLSLIGGASLKPADFVQIINAANQE